MIGEVGLGTPECTDKNIIDFFKKKNERDCARDDRMSACGILKEADRILKAYSDIPEVAHVINEINKALESLKK